MVTQRKTSPLSEYHGFFDITNDTTFFNYPFDFESVTFFFPYAWAKDPSKPTMTAKYESQVIPYKVSLSKYDISNIQREYQCGLGKFDFVFTENWRFVESVKNIPTIAVRQVTKAWHLLEINYDTYWRSS